MCIGKVDNYVNNQYVLRKEATMLILDVAYTNLYYELKKYEESGVLFAIDGHTASPLQIVEAHMLRETGTYMRDYEMNPEGGLKALTFYEVHERNYFF
jgi:hypothetical protein